MATRSTRQGKLLRLRSCRYYCGVKAKQTPELGARHRLLRRAVRLAAAGADLHKDVRIATTRHQVHLAAASAEVAGQDLHAAGLQVAIGQLLTLRSQLGAGAKHSAPGGMTPGAAAGVSPHA